MFEILISCNSSSRGDGEVRQEAEEEHIQRNSTTSLGKWPVEISNLEENEGVSFEDRRGDLPTTYVDLEFGHDPRKVPDEIVANKNYMKYYENPFCDGKVATPRNDVENMGIPR